MRYYIHVHLNITERTTLLKMCSLQIWLSFSMFKHNIETVK